MCVVTEKDVRELILSGSLKENDDYVIENDTILTPSAKSYLTEKNITIKNNNQRISDSKKDCVVTDLNSNVTYETLFGGTLNEKPEHMTHLYGNMLVFKDHPRIAFRGAIDSLESEIIITQIAAERLKCIKMIKDLEEIIKFIRKLLRCEIVHESVGEFCLQNLNEKELREQSYHPSKYFGINHFLPNYKQGELCAYLNKLRTMTRQTELIAYRAFKNEYGQVEQVDIIKSLNRLSSLFWIMIFKYLSGKYS